MAMRSRNLRVDYSFLLTKIKSRYIIKVSIDTFVKGGGEYLINNTKTRIESELEVRTYIFRKEVK